MLRLHTALLAARHEKENSLNEVNLHKAGFFLTKILTGPKKPKQKLKLTVKDKCAQKGLLTWQGNYW